MCSYETGLNGQSVQIYELQHYDTKILRVKDLDIEVIKPCSRSSIRAINQALSYIFKGHNLTCKDVCKDMESRGIIIDRSY